jgi:hypothetical protein
VAETILTVCVVFAVLACALTIWLAVLEWIADDQANEAQGFDRKL